MRKWEIDFSMSGSIVVEAPTKEEAIESFGELGSDELEYYTEPADIDHVTDLGEIEEDKLKPYVDPNQMELPGMPAAEVGNGA